MKKSIETDIIQLSYGFPTHVKLQKAFEEGMLDQNPKTNLWDVCHFKTLTCRKTNCLP